MRNKSQHSQKTYLLIGHVARDVASDGRIVVGGTVSYAGVAAKRFGWQPVVVTAAAAGFQRPSYLDCMDWHILPSSHTTTFKNEDGPQGRKQVVGPVARSITAADIPADCGQADVVHLCPIAQELDSSLVARFPDSFRVATPQGWMRHWNADGVVSLGDWRGAEQILPELDAAVVSIADIGGDWSLAERWARQIPILVVTQDKVGCRVYQRGEKRSFPARPARVSDSTGAGDVFAAAFFICLQETANPEESASVANVAASMALERPGPAGCPDRAEVEEYLAGERC